MIRWLQETGLLVRSIARFAHRCIVIASIGCHHVGMEPPGPTQTMPSSRTTTRPKAARSWLQRSAYDLSRILVRSLGWLLFRLRLRGIDRFPESGGALVCSNHQSYLDPVLLGALCDRRMNYLARENLFNSRFFGHLIRFYDAIPVRRDGMSITGLKETLRRLKRGEMVVIFPEGTRTEDGSMGSLKSGFCMLARKANVPLVPVGIAGAFEVWPKGQKLPGLSRVCLEAGEPIPASTVAELDDDELVSLLDSRIRACFESALEVRST